MKEEKKTFLVIGYKKKTHIQSISQFNHSLILFVSKKEYEQYQDDFSEYFLKVVVFNDIYQWEELKKQLDLLPQIDAVVTRFDHYVNVLGAINEYLGLKGLSYEDAQNFSNKYLMKQCFLRFGAPCADGVCLDILDNYESFLNSHPFPLIVKTTTGTHSKFVFKVESVDDLKEKREIILRQTRGGLSSKPVSGYKKTSEECQVLLEETLRGREISIDTFVSDGSYLHTPICEYILSNQLDVDDSYLPMRTMPAMLDKKLEEKIYQETEKVLESLSAKNCVCHTEFFIDENNQDLRVVESTPRGGGNRAEMIQAISEFDYDLAVFKVALGEDLKNMSILPNGSVTVVEYFASYEGVIDNIDISFLSDCSWVFNVKVFFKNGDRVKPARDGGQSILSFFVKNDNYEENRKLSITLFNKLRESIQITRF